MGANTFNIQRYDFEVQRHGGPREKVNPIISYQNIREFVDIYEYPYTPITIERIRS